MATFDLIGDEETFYKQVYEEFGKTKKDIEEYVDILEQWAKEQAHFPEIPSRNGIRFSIIATKFSLEKAKQKLDMYYTIRRLMPEIYCTHPLSPEMILQSKIMIMVPLPKLTKDFHRVLYSRVSQEYSPEHFKHERMLIQLVHLVEVCLQKDNCSNFEMIFDFAGAKLGHVPKFSPMVIKKLMTCLEKVYANRVAAIYFVNFYPFLENVLNTVFIPFLSKKIRSRIKVYENEEGLFHHIDKSILPKDVGGEERSLEELRVMWINKYEELKWRFDQIQYMKTDESKRATKLENDDILGYYGSFRQISVD